MIHWNQSFFLLLQKFKKCTLILQPLLAIMTSSTNGYEPVLIPLLNPLDLMCAILVFAELMPHIHKRRKQNQTGKTFV